MSGGAPIGVTDTTTIATAFGQLATAATDVAHGKITVLEVLTAADAILKGIGLIVPFAATLDEYLAAGMAINRAYVALGCPALVQVRHGQTPAIFGDESGDNNTVFGAPLL